jgi:hypothetical protein
MFVVRVGGLGNDIARIIPLSFNLFQDLQDESPIIAEPNTKKRKQAWGSLSTTG